VLVELTGEAVDAGEVIGLGEAAETSLALASSYVASAAASPSDDGPGLEAEVAAGHVEPDVCLCGEVLVRRGSAAGDPAHHGRRFDRLKSNTGLEGSEPGRLFVRVRAVSRPAEALERLVQLMRECCRHSSLCHGLAGDVSRLPGHGCQRVECADAAVHNGLGASKTSDAASASDKGHTGDRDRGDVSSPVRVRCAVRIVQAVTTSSVSAGRASLTRAPRHCPRCRMDTDVEKVDISAARPIPTRSGAGSTLEGAQPLVHLRHASRSRLPGPGRLAVPASSRRCQGCLPPSPAPPGSGCPQPHRAAATARGGGSLTPLRTHGASWRTWTT